MNTKLSIVLLVAVIALAVTACAPATKGASANVSNPVQPADYQTNHLVPVTGNSAPVASRAPQESRWWSGEIINSDNNSPDQELSIQAPANTVTKNACSSENDLERSYGGCLE